MTDEELVEIEEMDDYFESELDAVECSRVFEVAKWIEERGRDTTGDKGGEGA